jgi:hypothetical protein
MTICEEWWKNPTVNPRTNRKIKIDGPTYKILLKECGQAPTRSSLPVAHPDAQQPKPKQPHQAPKLPSTKSTARQPSKPKQPHQPPKSPSTKPSVQKPKPKPPSPKPKPKPPSPKPPSPKPATETRYSFDKLKSIYLDILPEIITKRTILFTYHPDKLPQELKDQISKYSEVSKFASRLFDDFRKAKDLTKQDIIKILDEERAVLGSPIRHQPQPQPKKPIHVVFISGMGCESKNAVRIATYFKFANINAIFHVECNESIKSILKNILKLSCYMKPNKKNEFVIKITDKVTKLLNDDNQVILLGHSYGGSVAAIVAESLNDHPNVHKLQVGTFGAIYIAKPKNIPNVRIRQYMFLRDVALKCNKLKEPKNMTANTYNDEEQHVTWIKNKYSDRWAIHNDYHTLIDKIIKYENIII